MTSIHQYNKEAYGSPRVHKALRRQGELIGKKRVERLMRAHQIKGRAASLYWSNSDTHAFFASIPNRQLDALATRPDQVWVGETLPISRWAAAEALSGDGDGQIPAPDHWLVFG